MIQFLRVCQPLDEPNVWREYVAKGDDQERAKLLRVRRDLLVSRVELMSSACRPSSFRQPCVGTIVPLLCRACCSRSFPSQHKGHA